VTAPRIVYHGFPPAGAQGGVKMAVRHVETLRDLGFNAVYQLGPANTAPAWLQHTAPVLPAAPVRPGDIVVLPEDAAEALRSTAGLPVRKVVFCQSQLFLAMRSLDALDAFAPHDRPVIMAVGPRQAATVRRLLPGWTVELVPCFADERRFRPGEKISPAILFEPKKRPIEPRFIAPVFRRLHPAHAARPWRKLEGLTEAEIASTFAAAELYLALPRFESVGLAALEAMASGCVCAGFKGIGGRDYATPDNGFWVDDDDLEAAADALGQAADLVATGGPALAAVVEAGRATAAQWSYARFREALEAFWMRHAPDARVRGGPLDGD
jgi:hypothetical protein